MRIDFTIDATALFYAVMDKTLLDKAGLESVSGATLGDMFALSKNESDAFFAELDNAINALCIRVPQLEWEPNDGINFAVESKRNIAPHSIALLVERALCHKMLFWWYESRNANLALVAEDNAKQTILTIKRQLEPNLTTRPYRYF